MARYILKRLLWMIPIVLGVAILTFTLMNFTDGDPAYIILGSAASEADVAALRETLGLNKPFLVRLLTYLRDIFLRFDLGTSYSTRLSVSGELMYRLPKTLLLTIASLSIAIVVGIPLGVTAAVNQNKLGDRISMVLSLVGVSMPNFWLAMLLVILFAVKLRWLPAMGTGGLKYYILPALAGATGTIASLARQTRSSMLEVIRADYITTARSKGVKERDVIYGHALPNALIPIITTIGSAFGIQLGGTIVLETIFGIPGIGSYLANAVSARDYPVVQGGVVFLAICFSFIMLVVDLAYAFVDPRIRAQYAGKKGK